jgi:DNA repair exonuclease SbcCD ATPase subunit
MNDVNVIQTLLYIFKYNREFHELINALIQSNKKLSDTAELPNGDFPVNTILEVFEHSKETMELAADKISNLKELEKELKKEQEKELREKDKMIHTLKKDIHDLQHKLQEAQNLLTEKEKVITHKERYIAELEAETKAKSTEIDTLTKALEKIPPGSIKHYNELTDRMIEFRDQLLYFRDEYAKKDDEVVAETSVKLLEMLFKETGRFMKLCGAEIIDEKGKFNSANQYIVGTVKTDDPMLDEMIESTFQPGYIIDGVPKRPQRVFVYTYDNK